MHPYIHPFIDSYLHKVLTKVIAASGAINTAMLAHDAADSIPTERSADHKARELYVKECHKYKGLLQCLALLGPKEGNIETLLVQDQRWPLTASN
eukprot:697211-Karenia_brevis.AAC.1